MKKISSKKSLTRKVLCSVMAAGMMGIAGTAFAANYDKTITNNDFSKDEDVIAGSYVQVADRVEGDVTVTVNKPMTEYTDERDSGEVVKNAEFFGILTCEQGMNVGSTGSTVNVTVNGVGNYDDTDVIGVLATDGSQINITGSTTIKTQMYDGEHADEYGVSVNAENNSKIEISGETIKLYGDVEARHGGIINLIGTTVSGDYIRLHNYYDQGNGKDIPDYAGSVKNMMDVSAGTIIFKDYAGLSAEGLTAADVARDSGQPVVFVNNSDLRLWGNTTISNAEGAKVLEGTGMKYYALRLADNASVVMGINEESKSSITGDVVIDSKPWIDTEDRPNYHSIPNEGKASFLEVRGSVDVNGNVIVANGSSFTGETVNLKGNLSNGLIPKNVEDVTGYFSSNVAGNPTSVNGGTVTIKAGTINGGVYVGNAGITDLGKAALNGELLVDGYQSKFKMDGGTINAVAIHYSDGDGYSEIVARNQGDIEIKNSVVNGGLTSKDEGTIFLQDSKIDGTANSNNDSDLGVCGNGYIFITNQAKTDNKVSLAAYAVNGGSVTIEKGSLEVTGAGVINTNPVNGNYGNYDGSIIAGQASSIVIYDGYLKAANNILATGYIDTKEKFAPINREGIGGNITVLRGNLIAGNEIVADTGSISVEDGDIKAKNVSALNTNGLVAVQRANLKASELVRADIGQICVTGGDLTAKNVQVANEGIVKVENGNIDVDTINVTSGGKVIISGINEVTLKATKILVKDTKSRLVLGKNATLASNHLDVLLQGSKNDAIALEGGTISTVSGQIFEKAIDTTSEETAAASNDVGSVTNTKINFTSGQLVLNDSMYTNAYYNSAAAALNNANMTIIMMGDPVQAKEDKPEEKPIVVPVTGLDKALADEEGHVAENVVHNNVTIDAGESSEKVTIGEDIKTAGVGSVDMSHNTSNTVEINKEFTLTGGKTGEIVSGTNNAQVVVGNETNSGVLNIGVQGSSTSNILAGDLTINAGSTVNVNNNTNVTGDINAVGAEGKETQVNVKGNGTTKADKVNANNAKINVNGALYANEMALKNANVNSGLQAGAVVIKEGLTVAGETKIDGNVEAGTLTAQKDSKLNVTGNIIAGNLTAPKAEGSEVSNTVINIGDKDKAGVASFETVELNGGMIFLDPAFKGNDKIEDASQMAVGSTSLNGHYVVGRNSVMTFGDINNGTAVKIFKNAAIANEMSWGKDAITAGAYLAKAINVEKGSLIVDGSIDGIEKQPPVPDSANNGTVKFEANSILMVESAIANGEAITGANAVTVDATSKLLITGNIVDGSVYKVFGEGIDANWLIDNVKADDSWVEFEKDGNGFKAKITSLEAQLGDTAPGAKVIDSVIKDENNKAGQALNKEMALLDKDGKAKVVNNIIQVSAQAGVASSAIVANAEVANAIGDHLGFASVAEVGGNGARLNKENGSAVWAKLIHKKADIDGLKVGSIGKADYDVKQNGIVAGLDIVNTEDKAFGVAITYMDGKVTGAAAKNDTENYGLSVYGKKKVGKAAIIADLSYIHGENDIKAGTVTEKPKSDALSLGIKAETAIKSGVGQFVPYVGARVTRLGIGDYKDSIGIKHDSDVENLFNIPVGIKYSANIQKGNWTMRPTVDLGYVFNVGNKDGQETVSYGGASNTFSYEMVDKSSFVGALGFEVENKNVAYNLGYQYTKGDNTKAHKYMLGFKVKF